MTNVLELVLELKGVSKSYPSGEGTLTILHQADLRLGKGEMAALVGPSGCGKSTLLHLAGLLDKADSGEIRILGTDYSKAGDKARTLLRREKLGFVYQFHHLLPEFTALENVTLPLRLLGKSKAQAESGAQEWLGLVGLASRAGHYPSQLSGGEQQRVAIARALVHNPQLVLADEPTGNLDPVTSLEIFQLLEKTIATQGITLLMVTHNTVLAKRTGRVLKLVNGGIIPA